MEGSVDLEGDGSGYSGTFRWKVSKKLNSLPSTTKTRRNLEYSNWMKYFVSRSTSDEAAGTLVKMVQGDLSIIDCLSTPLSICHLFESTVFKNSYRKSFFKKISIICLGCSSKAEERVLRETNCFLELCYYFYNVQHIDLWLVGPEMSATLESFSSQKNIIKNQLFTCSLYQGTSMQFFRSYPSYLNKSTVVVGFNCGFGNYENSASVRYNLLLNWLPDLYFLTGTNLPLLFTCANDYADLNGEVRVMLNVLGANLILDPAENPFSYASTLIPPNSDGKNGEFSRGNSFCYGVQGHTKERRHKISYSEGLKCIPCFLELFRVALPSLQSCSGSALLELEELVKSKPITTASVDSATSSASSDGVFAVTSTVTAAAAATSVAEVATNPSVDTAVTSKSVDPIAKPLAEMRVDDEPEQKKFDTDAVPTVGTEKSLDVSTCLTKSEYGNSNSSSNAVISNEEEKPYSVSQSVVDHKLTVTIALNGNVCSSSSSTSSGSNSVVDLTQADLRISEDGKLLHFALPTTSTTTTTAAFVATAGVDVIRLDAVVDHTSMRAKFSKKLQTLTITAQTKG